MKSKIVGVKNKTGGWNIKAKANDESELFKFFVVGFMELVNYLTDISDKKAYISVMKGQCEILERGIKQEDKYETV